MGFSVVDIINLLAMIISIVGTYLMFYYSPVINSQIYIYRKEELKIRQQKDASRNKMQRVGMFLLFVGFLLQAIALFLSVAYKQ